MPDLQTIVNRMIDAGESDANINDFITEWKERNPPRKAPDVVSDDEPGTFGEGFKKSLFSGEALSAGVEGLGGFLRGAIADIPETLWTGVKDAASVATHPIQTLKDAPVAFGEGVPEVAKQMFETTANAANDPHSFGRMMGQLTGQPAILGSPKASINVGRQLIGAPLEYGGRFVKDYKPLTSMLPRVAEPRIARGAQQVGGALAEKAGQFIRGNRPEPPPPPINPNAGGALVKKKVPTIEDQFADILQDTRKDFAAEGDPTTQMPRPAFERGAPKTRTDSPGMSQFGTPLKTKAELAESAGPTKKNNTKAPKTKTAETFEPSVDPATGEIFESPEAKRTAALGRAAEIDNLSNTTPTPRTTRSKGKFSPTIEPVTTAAETPESIVSASSLSPELKARVMDKLKNLFSNDNVEGSATIPEAADSLAERVTRAFDRLKNPATPVVPPGQVTNRQMLELSANRAAEERLAAQAPKQSLFSDIPGASEFSPDLMQYSDDVFEGVSPRFAAPEVPELPSTPPLKSVGQRFRDVLADETGAVGPDAPRLIKKNQERMLPKESLGEVASDKPVGPKGQSWAIHGPDGKHLGDINVSPSDVAEAMATPGLEGISEKDMINAMFEAKRDELLETHGLTERDLSRVKIEQKSAAKKVAKSTAPELPAEKVTAPIEEVKETLPSAETNKRVKPQAVDPDIAFGRGGDIDPILTAASDLEIAQAPDLKYKPLLPKSMQYGLGPGETFRQRLSNLLESSRPLSDPRMAGVEARMAERDKFIQSVTNPLAEEPKNIPLLDLKKVDLGKLRPGKINQQPKTWVSPRMQQQHPGLARLLKKQGEK